LIARQPELAARLESFVGRARNQVKSLKDALSPRDRTDYLNHSEAAGLVASARFALVVGPAWHGHRSSRYLNTSHRRRSCR
jgi:hypothetical protein